MDMFKHSVFLWALVSLHRRKVLGYAIPDDRMACWIWQFGQHLLVYCKPWSNPHPSPFKYDDKKLLEYNKNYPNGTLTFNRLTQWILNPSMKADGIWIGQYASLWDQAIDAQIQFQLDKTDENWRNFQAKMEVARKLPF